MLTLSPEQRNELWQRSDWSLVIRERAEKLVGHVAAFESPEEAADWAALAESIVPDRNVAIKLYTYAWCGRPKVRWIRRARSIALDLGEFRRVAELAGLEYEYRPSFDLLIVQALAYLDADLPEQALSPLAAVLKLRQGGPILAHLYDACSNRFDRVPQVLQELKAQVAAETDPNTASRLLLDMARLVRLYSGSADAEPYLFHAFELNPADENVFSLLENWWVACQEWTRLADAYRSRTEFLAHDGRDIDSYRRAGTRLATGSSLPGLGVRILQEGVQQIYKREEDNNQVLLSMLRLLVEHLVENGNAPSAVRFLAQGLSHPRSDDEAMWIVNFGIALAADDVAMQRTKTTFETLRTRLLDDNPEVADSMDMALESVEAEVVDWLEEDELSAIGDEIRELTRPSTLSAEVAERYDMVADVNVVLPAKPGEEPVILETVTRDLSETGLYLNCNTPLKVGDELHLMILLPGESDWILVEHEMHGEVVRVDGKHGYGIRFTEVPQGYLDGLEALSEDEPTIVS